MNRTRFLLAATAVLALLPAVAAASEAEDMFNTDFGERYKQATATPDTADDLVLATQMLLAAKAKDMPPALVALLCEKAYGLSSPVGPGYDTAAEAMEFMAARSPDKAAACWDKVLAIRQKQFDAARGLERVAAGEMLIEALLTVADATAKAGKAADLGPLYQKALTAATAAKSDRRGEIKLRLDAWTGRQKAAKTAADLKAKLQADPKDAISRKILLRTYLMDLDDPAQAAAVVDESTDQAMRQMLPLAAKGEKDAAQSDCLKVAQWYQGLAETAPPSCKVAMLSRAKAWYGRFLALHTSEDPDRKRAAAGLKKVEALLGPLVPAAATAGGGVGPGRWIDLLAGVDPAADAKSGKWYVNDGWLIVKSREAYSVLTLPCVVQGSYELQATLMRASGKDYVAFVLPAGPTAVSLALGFGRESTFWKIEPGAPVLLNGGLGYREDYVFNIRVVVSGPQAEFTVTRNNEPYLQWKGPVSIVTYPDQWGVKDITRISLCMYNGEVQFKSLRLRMLSGRASPQR